MKKLAIFDFDGTLFDSVVDVIICYNRALEIHNFPTLTRSQYLECLGGNIDEITALVLKDNNTPENVEMLKKTYLGMYDPSDKENTLPFANAHELLKKLQEKGVILAVNSNRTEDSLEFFINKFFSDIDFVSIEGHNLNYPSKPDPSGVRRILEKSQIQPCECVYIGDSKTDIKTAQNAGIDCIIVSWGYGNQNDWENDYILECVSEFDEILKYF